MAHKLWRLLIIIVIAILAWLYIDFLSVWKSITSISLFWAVIILTLITIDRCLIALKWSLIMRSVKLPVLFSTALIAYYQAGFIQRVFPSSLGGDAVRALVISSRHGQASVVFTSIFIEKILGIISAILLAMLAVIIFFKFIASNQSMEIIIISSIIFLVVILGFFLSMSEQSVYNLLKYLHFVKFRKILEKFYGKYLLFAKDPKSVFVSLSLTLIGQILQIFILVSCAKAISVDVPITIVIAAIAISQCLRKFAILLEGWLFSEFTAILVCTAFGISESKALAFFLMAHMFAIVASTPGIYFLIVGQRRSVG